MNSKLRYLLSSLMVSMPSMPIPLSAGPSRPTDAGRLTIVLDCLFHTGRRLICA